jgi:hypothetical protein
MKALKYEQTGEPHTASEVELVDRPTPFEEIRNRRGRFRVSEEMMQDHYSKLLPLFGQCIILRAEYRYDTRTFDYIAVSPSFDPVPPHLEAPEYYAIIQENAEAFFQQ